MSLEFQLAWKCPHFTEEEVVALSADRQTLELRQPIAASGLVRIMANDNVFIPSGGLYSVAMLVSTVSGPFDIVANEDTLVVQTSTSMETLSFGVSKIARMTADQVISRINNAGWTHVSVSNDNGHIVFVDSKTVGPSAVVKVRGSVAASLGFGQPGKNGYQWASYGREIYPGWDLYIRPDTITHRYPRFRKPLRTNPMLKVSYAVPVQRCLRCGASFIENDFRFTPGGHAILIQHEDLLYQAALKILLTDKGSNPFFPWYGTTIRQRIGSKALSGIASVLSEDVRQSLAQMQSLQQQQAKLQPVSFREQIYSVLNVNVKRHAQDPSTFMIDVTVQNASGRPVALNIVFTVPEVVALMGSNGIMLGTEAAGMGATEARELFKADRNLLTGGQ